MDEAELHDEVGSRLAGVGQRYTSNRRAVIGVLAAAGGPRTLPEILEHHRSLSQSSTYRSLAVLAEAGAVRRLVTGTDYARFELAEDLSAHHHHLVCASCGNVADFELDARTERMLDRVLSEAAGNVGFTADRHTLDVVGICATCQP